MIIMALHKNISNKPQYIVVNMVKTKIYPGDIVNLSPRDMQHAGSNIRHFESVYKSAIVDKENYSKVNIG